MASLSQSQTAWQLAFENKATTPVSENWFIDGRQATLENDPRGLYFAAGPQEGDHASHAVLWTRQSFDLPVKNGRKRSNGHSGDAVLFHKEKLVCAIGLAGPPSIQI